MWPFIINLEALKKNNDIKNIVFLPGTIAATACSPTTITFTALASKTTEYIKYKEEIYWIYQIWLSFHIC